MDWTIQDYGALGEIIGAIGVIATLAYLAFQIRQNTRQLAQNEQTRIASALNASLMLLHDNRAGVALNPEVSEIWLRGLNNPDELTETELYRFRLLFQNAMDGLWLVHSQMVGTGFLPDEWITQRTTLERLITSAGGRWFWSQFKDNYPDSYCHEVENILELNL